LQTPGTKTVRPIPLTINSFFLVQQQYQQHQLFINTTIRAVIPIGLASSLFLNGIFLAHHVHDEEVWTLVDVHAKRYGKTVEILISCCSISSFIMLLASQLVGAGRVLAYVWKVPEPTAIWLSAAFVWLYTYCGGLISVAYTDVAQGIIGWSGCFVLCMYLLRTHYGHQAGPPSIGFPGYVYPDLIGDNGVCDMYQGVPCNVDATKCCYNEPMWCPNGLFNCDRMDRGAYPLGDFRQHPNQMTDVDALAPFPNSLLYNWASIFILSFGNLGALDFQARSMAANSARNARLSCFFAGSITLIVGIPFAYLGSIVRLYYGPDSPRGVFEPDSCAIQLGLPTCAQWVPDSFAFIKLLIHDVPGFLGGWALLGIVAASMSTADGAILAIGTTFSHNVLRHADVWWPDLINKDNVLHYARVSTLLFTLISGLVAVFYRTSTGALLIVAFDIMFATSVVPLVACFYCTKPSPRAALASVLAGGGTRIVLEVVLNKDGSLIAPFGSDNFLNVGAAASSAFPTFMDVNATQMWDASAETCQQVRFQDWTGLDSLVSFLVSLLVFVTFQIIERMCGRPLFWFPWGEGYEKDLKQETVNNSMPESSDES
jgi:Na+/proline symporter